MAKLSDKRSIILDLRGNTGGSPEGARRLLSFFLEDNSHISTIKTKHDNQWQTEEFYTYPLDELNLGRSAKAPDLRSKPLYVLVDKNTFSAGEAIAYDLK